MKTISIKGKDYVMVKDRVLHLAETYPGQYSIETEYTYYPDRKMWVVKAILTIDQGTQTSVFTGLAQEVESENYKEVNYTSALENCETSAIGRACAAAGIGVLESYASADEMNKAMKRQEMTTRHQSMEIENLLKAAEIPDHEKTKIKANYRSFTKKRAEEAIEYLKKQIPELNEVKD